ncbi:hypothetical protein AB0G95_23170, partial [Streptomyces virginiae]|uniref:hypothetical protein n=1 Tax=Streptomyces virginiae TaxID=1961 RepID=UPI0034211CE6
PKWTGYQLLALIFGTLLSSQGTDASFVLTLSNIGWGFPPGFRFCCLAFPTLSDSFVSDFLGAFQVFAFALSPFRRFQPYQTISAPCFSKVAVGLDLNSVAVGGPFPFGRIRLYQVSPGLIPTRPHDSSRTHVCAGVSCGVET